ncbi:MAG: hypothetical protein LBT71_02910 [Azoarcus sp.]|nr:hypothetical protein [Azoarcus sp.]
MRKSLISLTLSLACIVPASHAVASDVETSQTAWNESSVFWNNGKTKLQETVAPNPEHGVAAKQQKHAKKKHLKHRRHARKAHRRHHRHHRNV